MHQFFVTPEQIREKTITIIGRDVHHIKQVLRMRPGEELSVSDGVTPREYRCVIEKIDSEEIQCRLIFIREEDLELPARIYLFQGLPKADKMEFIIQKAVELGVYEIIPVAAARSVVKLEEKKKSGKTARWQGIAAAAAGQSKRRIVPAVREPVSFKEAVELARPMDLGLIPYEMADGMARTKELLADLAEGQDIAVFIGPEGGFDDREIALAEAAGIIPITMGKRILRTETAGLVMLGWMMYQLEE